MALSTRKREPRQAGNGATVARKGVTGPFPIWRPALCGRELRQVDSRGVARMFPVSKRIGDRPATHGLELRHRRFRSVGSCPRGWPPRARFGNVQSNAAGGPSSELEPNGRRPRRDELFHLSEVVSTMWTESRNPNNAELMARPIAWSIAATSIAIRAQVSVLTPIGRVAGAARGRSSTGSTNEARLALSSGGKVTPANGQEHPRTEL